MPTISQIDRAIRKILIIEDDVDVAHLIGAIIRKHRYQPLTAHDGEAGLTSAVVNRPDGILLDLNMPGMGGFEFLKHRVKFEELISVPILVLTASRNLEDVERSMALGAVGYVAKPLEIGALLTRLEKHVPCGYFTRPRTTAVSWPAPAQFA